MDSPELRIGDHERDQAARLLQEHMAAGRLQPEEFDDRVTRALSARTSGELTTLFADLPGPRPGAEVAPAGEPVPTPTQPDEHPTPWYANWGAIAVAAILMAVTRGRAWPLLPLACLWVFWLYPQYVRPQTPRPAISGPPVAELPEPAQHEITALLRAGKKILAIKRHRELSGSGLQAAKEAVDAWERQLPR